MMTDWTPAIEQLALVIDVQPAGHSIHKERLEQWRRITDLPPILVTESGWLVDGHHRLFIARERNVTLWAVVVRRVGEHWVATGNLIRAR